MADHCPGSISGSPNPYVNHVFRPEWLGSWHCVFVYYTSLSDGCTYKWNCVRQIKHRNIEIIAKCPSFDTVAVISIACTVYLAYVHPDMYIYECII